MLAPPRAVARRRRGGARARACARRPAAASSRPPARFLCALLPAGGDDELFALAERLRARVAREAGEPLPAGAGRAVAPGRPAARLPRGALRAGGARARAQRRRRRRGALATYRDLGSFQLLLSLQDDDALRLFCDSILAPIEDSEGAYGGELMRSLEAFIECNGQWERAARALFCHRHTLRYRIRRVEELTGRSLDSRARPDRLLARPARAGAGPTRKDST